MRPPSSCRAALTSVRIAVASCCPEAAWRVPLQTLRRLFGLDSSVHRTSPIGLGLETNSDPSGRLRATEVRVLGVLLHVPHSGQLAEGPMRTAYDRIGRVG